MSYYITYTFNNGIITFPKNFVLLSAFSSEIFTSKT